ncbi:peptidase domain-containing ABC transporter [Paraferrimonas sp. SM1919]|uniref:peptidase domain-containing ABC transporter n=1 Tax=Paraferrimonas sp. SM1919 TaxID=2662263 RepID=UPI0013D07DAA|nr:peptidase domain-containing ABC transporter [Paraferrimonas sp. SM1919]
MSELIKFSNRRTTPLILQTEMAECGLACMAMVSSFYGHKLDMGAIRQKYSANVSGMNLQQLIELGAVLGLSSRALQCELSELKQLQLPCILHWDMNHFVVLTKVSGKGAKQKFSVNDPARGQKIFDIKQISKHFTGVCLELTPTNQFETKTESSTLRFYQLWSTMTGLKRGLVQLFLVSLVIQVLVLLGPYYMQWVVDEVLVSFDQALLLVLALGFGFIVVLETLTAAFRSWLIIRLSSVLNMQMGVNLLHHLMRLPMSFFESRHIGDLMSRFGSLAHIRERITTGFVETFVDGVMAISILVVMVLYSWQLAMIVVLVIVLYLVVRLILFRPFKMASEDLIQNCAKEQSHFLESLRAMQTIKIFAQENLRQSIWQNRYAEVINSEIKIGRLEISFNAFNKMLFGLENVVVIYIGALTVMQGQLTVGMLLAFISYKRLLADRATNLIEQIIQFKMMRLHLDRIADIALSTPEKNIDSQSEALFQDADIVLKDICFKYPNSDKWLLKNINLTVRAGDCIAIKGASGAGKTTLMKIMLGLLPPTSGCVSFGGVDITQIGLKKYRKQIAAVLQNDTLLAGSIADNICFFEPSPDFEKIFRVANSVAISQEIDAMPMQYNALVGDMGACLSGGQIQRLLLARALYKQPKALFLDEATCHLDKENEFVIAHQVKNMALTRVMVAHRQETIAIANKVYLLEAGSLSMAPQ